MWASGYNGDMRRAARGYEPTPEAAMAAFARVGGTRANSPSKCSVVKVKNKDRKLALPMRASFHENVLKMSPRCLVGNIQTCRSGPQ
jgi:hypothetical protein